MQREAYGPGATVYDEEPTFTGCHVCGSWTHVDNMTQHMDGQYCEQCEAEYQADHGRDAGK